VFGLDKALAGVALKQHSAITWRDVVKAGGTRDDVAWRLGEGAWDLVHHDVFRLAGVPWTYEAKVFCAVCAAGEGAMASHFCAARLHGAGFPTALVELSVPRSRFYRPKGITVHTSRDLDRCGAVMIEGIPVTDPARMLLDIAAKPGLSETIVRDTVSDARRLDLVDWNGMLVSLAAHARRGRSGVKVLREAIVAGSAKDDLTETDSELVAVTLIRENGFPEPTLQHEVRAADGRLVARMDIAYVDRRINYEIDGPIHLLPEVRAKDDERDHELRTRYGWTVRRIPWTIPLYEPRRFVLIVRDTLR